MLQDDTGLKELIPEFYGSDPSFLLNTQRLNLGLRGDKSPVDAVVLPKWAKSPTDFLRLMRQALESEWVSANLHSWIDLIFGCKQRGEHAVGADNGNLHPVFMPHNYEGGVNLDQIADLEQRRANEIQAVEYGQCPKQLFKIPHPARAPDILHKRSTLTPKVQWRMTDFSLRTAVVLDEDAHKREVSAVQCSENVVVSVGLDGGMCVFGPGKGKMTVDTRPLWTCSIRSDESAVLVAGYNPKLHLISLETTQEVAPKTWSHTEPVASTAYLPSLVRVYTGLIRYRVLGSTDSSLGHEGIESCLRGGKSQLSGDEYHQWRGVRSGVR